MVRKVELFLIENIRTLFGRELHLLVVAGALESLELVERYAYNARAGSRVV